MTSFKNINWKLKTLIVVILDESGSMASKVTDVLGGFNNFLGAQKKIDADEARMILVKFNTQVTVVHLCKDIGSIPELTAATYRPGGCTALYDAIAEGVALAEKAKTEDERVICVIMTDGEENSSRKTTTAQVRALVAEHEHQGDWTFLYIGEDPERWAATTGTRRGNVIRYNRDLMSANFSSADMAVSEFRSSRDEQRDNLFSGQSGLTD